MENGRIYEHTVDGRNPAPVENGGFSHSNPMKFTVFHRCLLYIGPNSSQLVQDFFHPQLGMGQNEVPQ